MRALIVGGGAVGTAIAYHLSARGAAVMVAEPSAIGCAASGKSGGFLAMGWCDGTPHAAGPPQLCPACGAGRAASRRMGLSPNDHLWRDAGPFAFARCARITAGVAVGECPHRWPAWIDRHHRTGAASGVYRRDDARRGSARRRAAAGARHGVAATRRTCRRRRTRRRDVGGRCRRDRNGAVVGARDAMAALGLPLGLPLPPVFGLKGHSLVFETGHAIPSEVLFLECAEGAGSILTPEIFPRADGTTYVCAISSSAPLPVDPVLVVPDDGAIDRLQALCAAISPVLASSRVLASQACFRPVTQDGLPLIGAIAGAPGAYVATGHSVWGILNAPATGEAVAELILDGAARVVDLSAFDPARLEAIDASQITVKRRRLG